MPKLTSEEALNQIAQDIHVMRDLMSTVVNALHDAEKEVHEKVRREMVKDENNRWDHTRAIGVSK